MPQKQAAKLRRIARKGGTTHELARILLALPDTEIGNDPGAHDGDVSWSGELADDTTQICVRTW
jgi:hypothetical protein